MCCTKRKYSVLSELRVTVFAYEQVVRGTINESELEYFWFSGDTQATLPVLFQIDTDLLTNTDVSWRGRAAFLVLVETFDACATVEELWPVWRLVMLDRAPRNQNARQRISSFPKSDAFRVHVLIV